jgi:hypothetical protein
MKKPAVNFREIRMGRIAPGVLYRSSHPAADGKQNKGIALLAGEAHIASVMNLTDSPAALPGVAAVAPWYNKLVKAGNVIALGMDFDFAGGYFCGKFREGLCFLVSRKSPCLIHCYAGLDRTGIVCAVLEAFMGASFRDICADYIESYQYNYSWLYSYADPASDAPSQAEWMMLDMFSQINNGEDVDPNNLEAVAERYLSGPVGLEPEELEALRKKLAAVYH